MRCSHCGTEMRRTRHERDHGSQVAWYQCPSCRSTTMSSWPQARMPADLVRERAGSRGRP